MSLTCKNIGKYYIDVHIGSRELNRDFDKMRQIIICCYNVGLMKMIFIILL